MFLSRTRLKTNFVYSEVISFLSLVKNASVVPLELTPSKGNNKMYIMRICFPVLFAILVFNYLLFRAKRRCNGFFVILTTIYYTINNNTILIELRIVFWTQYFIVAFRLRIIIIIYSPIYLSDRYFWYYLNTSEINIEP